MKTTVVDPHKSSLGMEANIAALLVYVAVILSWSNFIPFVGWFIGLIAWIAPIIFFLLEKESTFVKKSALQAILIGAVWFVFGVILSIISIPFIIAGLNTLVHILRILMNLVFTVVSGFFAFMAFNYKEIEIPGISPLVDKLFTAIDGAINKK